MSRNQWVRLMTNIIGVIGRGTGLSSIPFLQGLYLRLFSSIVPDHDIWVPFDGQEMLIPNPKKSDLSRMIYLHGSWEDIVSRILCQEVRRGMTTLDIGAHVGYYTLLMAKRVGEEGRVIAFEPNADVRKYIEQSVQRNGYSSVTLCPYALFHKGGFGALEGSDNLQSRLSQQLDASEGSFPVVVFDDVKESLGIDKVDFLKMDVEGAELDILFGMRATLEQFHPRMIVEVHVRGLTLFRHSELEIREYIRSFGYTIRDIWSQNDTITILCKPVE